MDTYFEFVKVKSEDNKQDFLSEEVSDCGNQFQEDKGSSHFSSKIKNENFVEDNSLLSEPNDNITFEANFLVANETLEEECSFLPNSEFQHEHVLSNSYVTTNYIQAGQEVNETSEHNEREKIILGFDSDLETSDTTIKLETNKHYLPLENQETIEPRPLTNPSEVEEKFLIQELPTQYRKGCHRDHNKNLNVRQRKSTQKSSRKSNAKKYTCDHCQKSYTTFGHLKAHILEYIGEKEFSCSFCPKRFTRKITLDRHILRHKNIKLFTCKICFKEFTQKPSWTYHMLEQHSSEKPFRCMQCEMSFTRKCRLKLHILRHSGINNPKLFCCEFCSRMFTMNQQLKAHLLVHTGIKQFSCEFCNKKFALKATLRSHLQTHTQEKPFICDTCNKSFARKEHLKSHISVHTGIHRHFCTKCGNSFRDKWRLLKHPCDSS